MNIFRGTYEVGACDASKYSMNSEEQTSCGLTAVYLE